MERPSAPAPQPSSRLAWALATGLAATCLSAGIPEPASNAHPRLVSLQATRCTSCHQKLVEGKRSSHSATADCENCHSVLIQDSGTLVGLKREGAALCLSCHEAFRAASDGSIKAPHAPVLESCTHCHDPHASDAAPLLVVPRGELCRGCHDLEGLQRSHDGQVSETTRCGTCHLAHGSATPKLLVGSRLHPPFEEKACEACHRSPRGGRVRLIARGEALCTSCHGDHVPPAGHQGSVHEPIRSSRTAPGCLSCHNPHLSPNERLLNKKVPELCRGCHPDVVRAATDKTGHPPAGEDCLSCHRPHLSNQPRLLAEQPPALCLTCHDVEPLKKAHLGADVAALACTQCHTPHGSGNAKLLARTVHPPALEDCGICHEGRFDKLIENGESALCLSCHDEIGKKAASAPFPHAALEVGRCADCHNPHASAQEHLVKGPGGGPCVTCHEDKAPLPGESGHGVINLLGCRACHEPHGADNEKLLRARGNALCLGCHDLGKLKAAQGASVVKLGGKFEVPVEAARRIRTVLLSPAQRGHPIPNHPVTGKATGKGHVQVTFDGELECLTCHDPHKGRSPKILRWQAASSTEACLHCHPK